MSGKHTPEPWHQGVYDNPRRLALAIFSEGHDEVAVCDTVETARRIVACVNALEGVATDRLEAAVSSGSGFWGKCIHDADVKYSELAILNKDLTAQRDELLAALKREHATMPGYHDDEHCAVCALIKRIEGGK